MLGPTHFFLNFFKNAEKVTHFWANKPGLKALTLVRWKTGAQAFINSPIVFLYVYLKRYPTDGTPMTETMKGWRSSVTPSEFTWMGLHSSSLHSRLARARCARDEALRQHYPFIPVGTPSCHPYIIIPFWVSFIKDPPNLRLVTWKGLQYLL